MQCKTMRTAMPMMLFCCVLMSNRPAVAAPPPKDARADIYDKTADGMQQIADALIKAKRANKHVLMQFGANWCGWCHKLHDLFKKDSRIAKVLMYDYEVVLIDVDRIDGKQHNVKVNERYGNPTKLGLPVLVVLDADGKQLITRETGALEDGDHHDPAKVLAFLEKWKPKPLSADDVLTEALGRAKKESKKAFVYFSAPWCGWCHRLEEYLYRREIAAIFNQVYTPVKIDVDRMTGGKALKAKLSGSANGGIPFFVVLEPDGTKVADSNGAKGNIGFPVEPHEIAHFMKVVRQTAPGLSAEQRAVLATGLEPPKK